MFPKANGKSKLVTATCIDCGNDFQTPVEYVTRTKNRKVRCDDCQKEVMRQRHAEYDYDDYYEKKSYTPDRPRRYIIVEDAIPYDRRVWSSQGHYPSDEFRPRIDKYELAKAKKENWFIPGTVIIDSATNKREVIK